MQDNSSNTEYNYLSSSKSDRMNDHDKDKDTDIMNKSDEPPLLVN